MRALNAGGSEAVDVASRLGELIRAHQDVLNRTGLAPTWAALLALAHKPRQPGGHVSDELAASKEQAAALQQLLQKQAHRASRYKEHARHLEVCTTLALPVMLKDWACMRSCMLHSGAPC